MSKMKSRKSEIFTALQSTLEGGIDKGIPGLSAAISSAQGTLWHSSAGLVDISSQVSVDESHTFGIGSITKVFTSVVILQLLDEQKLKLSDTVGDILEAKVSHNIKNGQTATVADLLNHTAGVESWEDDPVWIVEARGRALDAEKIWRKEEPLDYIRRPNPAGPQPGMWSYSNTNFTLLGLMIEKVTQNPAESEIRRRILEPLNMKHTYLEGFEEPQLGKLSNRYHWATETFRKTAGICSSFSQPRGDLIDATGSNLSVEWVAGGMISSPTDLLKFTIALRDGKLLSPSSLEFMKDWRPAEGSAEMGHGIFRQGKWLGHFGSVLGYTAALLWKEEGDCAVCVVANVGTMHAGDVPSSAVHVMMKTEFLRLALELASSE